ncbi:Isochorismatase hydrolase protein [Azotobacter vinelandii CA]|uniref:Isochorismatase hydrolase protein n=2 Tax=Azotobacter vinelandii TaxID=354 RepID=C1DHG5_AZOVD|nr:cysteine hydrolase family protein [Azotobacter vinelandii]ACO78560.1 Isochorismatase hydrolase protein [Azotobacter vinelandii DJ]AGK16694.1 Isochorismatase hydrolase protein [Azotobacter vinelandii CA]AGK20583.1 Isochorismatase hydrolase protein [Azotobacter vinelandii CA6]WKN24246.1 cysteine hydrolase [Azotobacter vinelandii]SFX59027.1 Nicotinamidase-related amidase [Azotobacter vinelandii]
MPQPQTVMQITGRSFTPAHLKNATLLVIDAQEEYRSGILRLPGLESAIVEIAGLLAAARAAGTPVVHVKHLGIPGGFLDPQGTRGQLIPEVAPQPGEIVVEKRLPNAFSGTDLHDRLQAIGRLDLIVCGFMTHSSISSTVRATKDYGYRCTLVDRACATRDLPSPNGTLSAEQVHRVEIASLADNFAAIVPDAQALL